MPAVLKVRETLQLSDDGGEGWMNESSSKWTLWNPPVLFHVTVSPRSTVTSRGENWLEMVALTV